MSEAKEVVEDGEPIEGLTASEVATLKAKHAGEDLRAFATSMGAVVFRCPTEAEFGRFTATVAADEKKVPAAMKRLVQDCLVHPDATSLQRILTKRPGLAIDIGNEVGRFARDKEPDEAKKL